jgi:hypothetical protein
MKRYRFELILGAALVVLYLVFSGWHSQWGGKLTKAEIDQYLAVIEKLPLPAEEIQAITSRIRPWADADDGKPVYMVNLMHFFPRLRTFLKLLSDPAYGPMEPYKFMAVELDLTPDSGDMVIPDLRWVVGGSFAVLFLAVGWFRAARQNQRT